MNIAYGQVSNILAAGGGTDQTKDVDAGVDATQAELFIIQPDSLTGLGIDVSLQAVVTTGSGAGNASWALGRAKERLGATFNGIILSAFANCTKWRVNFTSTVDRALVNPIQYAVVVGRSNQQVSCLSQTVHLANQVLPAAGAWVAPTNQPGVMQYKYVQWSVSYTAVNPGVGAPKFRVMWSGALGNTFEDTVQTVGGIQLDEPIGPSPPDANAQLYTFASQNRGGFSRVRLEAAEAGDVTHPGTIETWISARAI